MIATLFLIASLGVHLASAAQVQAPPPVSPAAAPPAAGEKAVELVTAAERPFVGRWCVDLSALEGDLKKRNAPQDEPRRSRERYKAMELAAPVSVDIREDRTALVLPDVAVLPWKLVEGELIVGDGVSRDLVIKRDGERFELVRKWQMTLTLKPAARGKPITAAVYEGEWVVDREASTAANKERLKACSDFAPEMSAEDRARIERYVQRHVTELGLSLSLAAKSGTVSVRTVPATPVKVTVIDDTVLLATEEAPKQVEGKEGKGAANRPDIAIALRVDGERLRGEFMNVPFVFKRAPAKPPVVEPGKKISEF